MEYATDKREVKTNEHLKRCPEAIFVEYLKNAKEKSAEINNCDKMDIEERKKRNDTIIKNANNWFLINVLSPEIQMNEQRKRKHKDWLMWIMGGFIFLQFVMVASMVIYSGYHIIDAQVKGTPFDNSTIKIIFTFIGTYITSVIVELIAILKYIVKNVFDTSVAGMVNNFKDNNLEK